MRRFLLLAGFGALAACGRERGRDVAMSDSLTHELQVAPPDSSLQTTAAMDSTPTVQRTQDGARPATRAPASKAARVTKGRGPAAPRGRPTTTARAPTATAPTAPTPTPASEAGVSDSADTSRGYATSSAIDTIPAGSDAASADTVPAPVDTEAAPAPAPVPTAPAAPAPVPTAAPANAHALPVGTHIRALLEDSIHSRRNSAGQSVTAVVSGDVRAPDGSTIVPSGSTVRLTIARLHPARTRSAVDGELELHPDSILVAGRSYPVKAEVQPVPHELKGRGVTAGEAEKVAAGAAVGAAAGGVITGKTKGAVIGGAVGAAGGAVVAAQTASRDVVVVPKTMLVLVLTAPLTREAR